MKRGINVDITIPPLEKDKKDNDVDFKVKIAPNNAIAEDKVKCKSLAPDVNDVAEFPEISIDFETKDKKTHKITFEEVNNVGELKVSRFDFAKARNILVTKAQEFKELKKTQEELYGESVDEFIKVTKSANERLSEIAKQIVKANGLRKQLYKLKADGVSKDKVEGVEKEFIKEAGILKVWIGSIAKKLAYVMVEASGVAEYEKTEYPSWSGEVPAGKVEVKYLNRKNGFQNGEKAKGDVHGWKLLQEKKLTNGQGGTYVRMHIVSAELGGPAKPGKLAAAPQEVNREFYDNVEKKAIQDVNAGGMIWFRVNLSFNNEIKVDEKISKDNKGTYKFLSSITAKYGGYKYEGDKWVPDKVEGDFSKSFAGPEINSPVVNVNSENDPDIIHRGLKVSKAFADKFIAWRNSNKKTNKIEHWDDEEDLLHDLENFDKENPEAEVKIGDTSRYINNIKWVIKEKKVIF